MRILLINNFHYIRGGDCRYTFDLAHILKKHGHEVMHFSMHHPKNEPYFYDRYFISNIDFAELNRRQNPKSAYRVITTTFWNLEAQRKISELIREYKPDVAHLQSIMHHITPSIIPVLKKHGVPIIHHLHDYNMICPDYYLWRKGYVCEKCLAGKYYHCILNRCKKESLAASVLAAVERYFHEAISVYQAVSYFIVPTMFCMQKLMEGRFRYSDRLVYIPHFVNNECITPNWEFEKTKGVVFAGRLIEQKGVWTLLKAAAMVPDIPIIIFGEGEVDSSLRKEVIKKNLTNIHFMGWRSQSEILNALQNTRALVMPSEWYETAGISILEAAAIGRPAIVPENTSMNELVKYGKDYLTFPMGAADKLAAIIRKICADVSLAERLGREARKLLDKVHSAKLQYIQIKKLYEQVIRDNN